jgi:PAS domain S-box-containing protein
MKSDNPPVETLPENEAKFRTIFDRASDGLLIADTATKRFLHGNDTICTMLGYTKAEIENLTIYDIHPPEDMARVLETFEKQVRQEIILAEDLPVLRKDGTVFYADISSAPAVIGGVHCVLGIFRDISARKQAEKERNAHIRFLKNLERVDRAIKNETDVEQMLQPLLEVVFSIYDCDRAWLFYPCDPESPTFRVPMEICRPEYPGAQVLNQDLPLPPDMADNLRDALASERPVIYIAGTSRPINQVSAEQFGVQSQMFTALYPKMGKPWVLGMHQCAYPRVWTSEEEKLFTEIARRTSDGLSSLLFLRELRENEERFRATFEQAAVGIGHAAVDGQWLRVNRRLCEIVGYTKEELLQKTLLQITYPEDMAAGQECLRQLLTGETPTCRIEKRFTRKDGSAVWIDLTVSTVRGASGDAAYLIVVVEDISKRKEDEAEKQKLQDQLLQAQKMESVGRLAGGVAHDFNNMLGVILGQSELALLHVEPSDPFHHNLVEIRKAGQRAADLTRQLLAFARKQTVLLKVIDLNAVVSKMLSMLRRLIGEDIELTWLPDQQLWPIRMDPSQIDQILANLCVNARDACAGVGTIIIETNNVLFDAYYCDLHPGFNPGEYVQLTVSDSGSGMTREVLGNLFEPFFTTKAVGQGTGLGLSTVYGIVKQNLGFINVYSEPGTGSTFKIYLPRFTGQSERAAEKERSRPVAGGQETILLVEDETALLNLGQDLLKILGYRVLTAGSPGEAVRTAEDAGVIDLLVTDVVMPEMTGWELSQRLLSSYPNLKSLFMSGYTADIIGDQGILKEGLNFIQKPFSIKDLGVKVREILSKK